VKEDTDKRKRWPAALPQDPNDKSMLKGQLTITLPESGNQWLKIGTLTTNQINALRFILDWNGRHVTLSGIKVAIDINQQGDFLLVNMALYQEDQLAEIFGNSHYQLYTLEDTQKVNMIFFYRKDSKEDFLKLQVVPEVNIAKYDIPQQIKEWFYQHDVKISYGSRSDKA
jgi:hypothetical protein